MAGSVNFYEDATGNAPVEQFLEGLTKKQRAKLVGLIDNLKQYGLELPFPYSSHVRGRIWELRTRFAKARLRVLYFGECQENLHIAARCG